MSSSSSSSRPLGGSGLAVHARGLLGGFLEELSGQASVEAARILGRASCNLRERMPEPLDRPSGPDRGRRPWKDKKAKKEEEVVGNEEAEACHTNRHKKHNVTQQNNTTPACDMTQRSTP
jgi:hypothetical protein